MSQQSNPATLREALAIVAEEMQGALSARTGLVHKDYIKRWLEMIELAASGTEAAPGTQVKMRLVCRYCGHEAQEGEWVGVHGCSKCNPSTIWGAAQPMNIPPCVPAQTAASPEGEGRKGLAVDDIVLLKARIVEIVEPNNRGIGVGIKVGKIELSLWVNESDIVRQSTAPSGGATLTNAQVEAAWQQAYNERHQYGLILPRLTELLNSALAQESKTGVVTETK